MDLQVLIWRLEKVAWVWVWILKKQKRKNKTKKRNISTLKTRNQFLYHRSLEYRHGPFKPEPLDFPMWPRSKWYSANNAVWGDHSVIRRHGMLRQRVATMLHSDSHKASGLTCTLAPCGRWAVAALWSEHPAALRLPFAGRRAAGGHEACSHTQQANTLSFLNLG